MHDMTMTIAIDSQGRLQVSGPIHEPVLCLGLLELAKDLVLKQANKPRPAIVPANGIALPRLDT